MGPGAGPYPLPVNLTRDQVQAMVQVLFSIRDKLI
jgi:hypothetical protein